MVSQKCSPEELFGKPKTYEERKAGKRSRNSNDFDEYDIALAMKNVTGTEEHMKGAEELNDTMPELIIKFVGRLSEQNGGNLGWRATFNGVKANISWCIGHGLIHIHDNYTKALTGYYVNSASVSSGKTLDKIMHEDDIIAVIG